MTIALLIALGVAIVLALSAVILYNGLVNLKHSVGKAWANIDVILKQRHDELPKLVEVCRQYMSFEKETLAQVTAARGAVFAASTRADVVQLGAAEATLQRGLGSLFALAESYPELKANENFRHLRERISQLENALADRRELYNDTVNLNNIRVEEFPDLLIARLLSFGPRPLLEFTLEETRDVDLRSLFH